MDTKTVIVGAGRLGRSAAQILDNKGHPFVLVGRGDAIPPARLTWLTVPDREIANASERVPEGGVVLHASGAHTIEPLSNHTHAGSLHPLMTFPGPEMGLPTATTIPAAVAGHPAAVRAAKTLAHQLGFSPFVVPGDRVLYHAAAVIAGNFASLLLIEAGKVLAAAGVPEDQCRNVLLPLATASLNATAHHGPSALTGPVARSDDAVIRAHMDALARLDPSTRELYGKLVEATRKLKT